MSRIFICFSPLFTNHPSGQKRKCRHKQSSHRKPSSRATSAPSLRRSYSIPIPGRSPLSRSVSTNQNTEKQMYGRLKMEKSCFPVLSSMFIRLLTRAHI